ncbi:MAG: DUF992 domain-containing protein [Hyphomicrobiaceae bacterium]|nr:DUF992 domain-containing protein [Hyphomicrobiaceae bacterium]
MWAQHPAGALRLRPVWLLRSTTMSTSAAHCAKSAACALLVVLLHAGPGWAADRLAPAGSLFCTTSDADKTIASRRVVSCAFKGLDGGGGGLEGRIVLKGEGRLPLGKHVLAWSVLAPQADVKSQALAGTYVETGSGGLVGGQAGDIVLVPATNNRRAHDEAITILELHVDPTKA